VQQTFDQERRGFDQRQVRDYLRAVADSLQDAQEREAEIRTRLGKAIRRAEAAEKKLRDTAPDNDAEVNRRVGEEVASVLDAARSTGDQRIAAAEKSAQKLMASAKAESSELRKSADEIMQQRSSEAEAAAVEILGEGRAEADAAREQAKAESAQMLAKAEERLLQARDEGDGLIREAEEARAQILEDMERRRRQARAQVERLRVGRDRLLRSYDLVRRTLEETTVELKSSLKEAKVRGDSAARAITNEPLADREQLEGELADAKLIGLIKVSESKPSKRELSSPALPRKLDPPPTAAGDATQLRVTEAMKRGPGAGPKAPAVAPVLKASPSSPLESTEDPDLGEVDAELAALEDDNLDVVAPSDAVEKVVAVPPPGAPSVPNELFAMLRQQSGDTNASNDDAPAAEKPAEAETAEPDAKDESGETNDFPGIEAQRDAVIADAAKQLEKRLKRALADEQNELLAGIRSAKKKKNVELTSMVGDVDMHINRYVVAITEVAAVTYGAGAALVDADPAGGQLPAGAVEELLAADVVLPIRERLESLDALSVDAADAHLDPVRAFYRQRKTDHLGLAASRLANLLCVAGLCDALPESAQVPWAPVVK